ncbi:MAG: hypothetical protein J5I47_05680 [Vicingus serpentipes]|nr:hypothetical protein [Vicingus serpentipes]
MKKILVGVLALISSSMYGQNNYPSSGNVGLGFTNPSNASHKLSVGMYDSQIASWSSALFYKGIAVSHTSDKSAVVVSNQGAGFPVKGIFAYDYGTSQYIDLYVGWGGNDVFLSYDGGRVSIGTTINSATLNIGGTEFTSHFYHGTNENTYIRPGKSSGSVIMDKGNVGIGTTIPSAKLDVHGDVRTNNFPIYFKGAGDNNHGLGYFSTHSGETIDGPVLFGYSGGALATNQGGTTNNALIWKANGEVGIGTDKTSGFKLSVAGKVRAEEIEISLSTTWADYVFAKDYQLNSLEEVSSFIEKNNHLPNVPSAKEVEENGINLGEMDAILLRKIEELTLYVIEQDKKIKDLEKAVSK